jgi:nucleotide-binding universal stress UspA family protein
VKRILVGFDGSDGGRRALDRAIEEAERSTVHITVVSIENMPLDPEAPRHFGTLGDISASEGAVLAAPPDVVGHLQEANERLSKAGLTADLIWAAGEPGAAIVEAAKRVRANLIVVGEHHHGFLSSFFGGNVDEEIQREAGCEVALA